MYLICISRQIKNCSYVGKYYCFGRIAVIAPIYLHAFLLCVFDIFSEEFCDVLFVGVDVCFSFFVRIFYGYLAHMKHDFVDCVYRATEAISLYERQPAEQPEPRPRSIDLKRDTNQTDVINTVCVCRLFHTRYVCTKESKQSDRSQRKASDRNESNTKCSRFFGFIDQQQQQSQQKPQKHQQQDYTPSHLFLDLCFFAFSGQEKSLPHTQANLWFECSRVMWRLKLERLEHVAGQCGHFTRWRDGQDLLARFAHLPRFA